MDRRHVAVEAEPLSDAPGIAPSETAGVLASIGEAAYRWDIGNDELAWSANVGSVLAVDRATIATGRLYAAVLDRDNMQTRFDAVMHSVQRDDGRGVPYQIEYCLRLGAEPHGKTWIEDTGRWFAASDGRPTHAHGVIRVVNERHAQQERLSFLSRYDALTGEMNRWHLTDVLGAALQDAIRFRSSCGFLLVAIDDLARINEAYGFDAADEVIAAVAKRIRGRMRGGDSLGRFSGNKFGVVLNNCTPEDMAAAADRLLAEVRDEVVRTSTSLVAVTATIGGVTAPRHARSVHEILARAQESLDAAKAVRRGSFSAYRPSIDRDETRRENAR
jgi:diguanylate cyclase (GGDEF)-like protein